MGVLHRGEEVKQDLPGLWVTQFDPQHQREEISKDKGLGLGHLLNLCES